MRMWTDGVQLESQAKQQLINLSKMPFIKMPIAVMPDVHWGMGATIGSVIPFEKAIIPAAVGVDIGCGMMAVKTSIKAENLPDNLFAIRSDIESMVPHGRTGGKGRDKGAWGEIPENNKLPWSMLEPGFTEICDKHPKIAKSNSVNHLGTLGSGNHFIELCIDEGEHLWIMLHSGSRGVGNRIGTYFISLAKKEMERWFVHLPDENLAYLPEGSEYFNGYIKAVDWAQRFASENRKLMMVGVYKVLHKHFGKWDVIEKAVNCHHNYVQREHYHGRNVWLTRKGAVSARKEELGIIPGSMGAKSFIVRGKGNELSYNSCSHGAGRKMSRTESKKLFTVDDHIKATAGVECRKDELVIDETPMAYKDIDKVMNAQKDLVEIVHTLKQVVCVKG